MRLLLVEDDPMIGEAVLDLLRREGYAVDWVRDGKLAESAVGSNAYDMLLLDLTLPGRDGLAVLRSLRVKGARMPVLIMTARDRLEQRVAGLDAGADDYVLKPFELDELLARIRALLRRSFGQADTLYRARNVTLNATTREVLVDDRPVTLSAREWTILEALIARPGQILSRQQLEQKLFAWKDDIASNAVEVYIHGLRRKIGSDVVVNVRGMGYTVPKE